MFAVLTQAGLLTAGTRLGIYHHCHSIYDKQRRGSLK